MNQKNSRLVYLHRCRLMLRGRQQRLLLALVLMIVSLPNRGEADFLETENIPGYGWYYNHENNWDEIGGGFQTNINHVISRGLTGHLSLTWYPETTHYTLPHLTISAPGSSEIYFYVATGSSGLNIDLQGSVNQASPTITTWFLLAPNALTHINSTRTFNISGIWHQGPLTGAGGLTKTGSGSMNLYQQNNSYAGLNSISGGALSGSSIADQGVNSSFGKGNFSLSNNAILRYTGANASTNRTIEIGSGGGSIDVTSASETLTVSSNFSGGNLLKQGVGGLALPGENRFNKMEIHAGSIRMQGTNATTLSGPLVIAANNLPSYLNVHFSGSGNPTSLPAVIVGKTGATQHGGMRIDAGRVVNTSGEFESLGNYDGSEVYRGYGYLGLHSGAQGVATIHGVGSEWNIERDIYVGVHGQGSLVIQQGGRVNTSGSGVIANSFAGQSSVVVSNPNSTWQIVQDLYVGVSGIANMTVQNGGRILNGGTSWLGYSPSASGAVTVTGAGSSWDVASDLYVGGSSSTAGGIGHLKVESSGKVNIFGAAKLWNAGSLTLNGGTFSTHHLDASVGTLNFNSGTLHTTGATTLPGPLAVGANSTFINDGSVAAPVSVAGGGFVKGAGTFGELTVNAGGFASPGNSPGSMTDTSTTWNGAGTYVWEINQLAANAGVAGGDPGWDLWNLGELTVNATNGNPFVISLTSLDLANDAGALAGWNAATSHQWMIATASNSGGVFGEILGNLSINTAQFASHNTLAGGSFSLFAGNGGSELWLQFNPVPEPSTLALASASGLVAFGLLRRRRREMATLTAER